MESGAGDLEALASVGAPDLEHQQSPGGAGELAALACDALAQAHQALGFVHLHVHSSFSLREGALSIARLAKLALADSMPALAITDTNSLFGALEFSEKLAKEGVQPIIGIQLTVDFGDGAQLAPRGGETGAGARRSRPAGEG